MKVQTARAVRSLLAALTAGVGVWYLAWRLTTFNPDAWTFSVLLYAAEVFTFATLTMFVFTVWEMRAPPPIQASPGHSVDVFVATYNEEPELLRKTLLGCSRIRYPHTTWVLDDGRRPEVAALAQQLGCKYLTRANNKDAKAGNLNNALAHTQGEFIVTLDADHIPLARLLDATLGYFEPNPKLAFVQLPQTFYNLDSMEHQVNLQERTLWDSQSLFFERIMLGKNRWNAAFYCGSPAVLRRKALEKIGGFATGSITEDVHTSITLHRHGWDSLFVPETLAYGQATSDAREFHRQRKRWSLGGMQVFRRANPLWVPGLTLAQRINYFASIVAFLDGGPKLIFYVTPLIILLTGVLPILSFGPEFLLHFVPYFALSLIAYRVFGGAWGRYLLSEQYNILRYYSYLAGAFAGLVGKKAKFHVTSKQMRGPRTRPRELVPPFVVAAVSLAAVGAGFYQLFSGQQLPLLGLVLVMSWAGFHLLMALAILHFTLKKFRRRAEFRFPDQLPVLLGGEGKNDIGVALDLNTTGLQVQTAARLLMGESLLLTLYTPGRPLQAGVNVQTPPRQGDGGLLRYGLRFTSLEPIDRDFLSMLVLEHSMPKLLGRLRPTRAPDVMRSITRLITARYRQRARRRRVHLFLEFEYPTGRKQLAVTDDCSVTGITFMSNQKIPVGTRLDLILYRAAKPESLAGEVVRAIPQTFSEQKMYRMAVRLRDATPGKGTRKPRAR